MKQERVMNFRSLERVKKLGEVFTPDAYIEKMLQLVEQNNMGMWTDENVIFFEPTCGHGNIVLLIYGKRLEHLYEKFLPIYKNEAVFYAVSVALNSLWALDIDPNNIEECRTRVLQKTKEFFKEKKSIKYLNEFILKNNIFFAHVLCCLRWHIRVNEALTALCDTDQVNSKAASTRVSREWMKLNKHETLDFNFTWVENFLLMQNNNIRSLEFERAAAFIENICSVKRCRNKFKEFYFAESCLLETTSANDQTLVA